MAITNTDEFLAYSSFNDTGGVTTSDTFNTWRKKTNGIINAIDSITIENITPSQLSLGAPTWDTSGNLSTYLSPGGILGSFAASVITAGSINTGSSGNIITGNITTNTVISNTSLNSKVLTLVGGTGLISTNGEIQANSLAIGTSNNKFTVSSLGAVVSASTIAGISLKVGGSGTPVTGGVYASSLAIGSSNSEFTVSTNGAIVTTASIGAGAITCTSLNAGSGTITTTGNIIAAAPTQPTHLATKLYVDTTVNSAGKNNTSIIALRGVAKDIIYQNTSGHRLFVSIVINGGNDIFGFAAHISNTSLVLNDKNANYDSGPNGITSTTCVAYEYHVSDGQYGDVTTLIFIVPNNYFWKVTGDADVMNSFAYEI